MSLLGNNKSGGDPALSEPGTHELCSTCSQIVYVISCLNPVLKTQPLLLGTEVRAQLFIRYSAPCNCSSLLGMRLPIGRVTTPRGAWGFLVTGFSE